MAILDDDMERLADTTRMKTERAPGYEKRYYGNHTSNMWREIVKHAGAKSGASRHKSPTLKLRDFSKGPD